MKLTKAQEGCPYCHSEKPIIKIRSGEICVYIENGVDYLPLDLVYDFSYDAMTDEEFMNAPFGRKHTAIHYCPMCGRPLNKEDE